MALGVCHEDHTRHWEAQEEIQTLRMYCEKATMITESDHHQVGR